MASSFRRLSKSKIGTFVMAVVLLGILAGFAISDLSNFGSGQIGFGSSDGTLVTVGGQKVTDKEMNDAMQRRLLEVRQQQPNAEYATIAGDFPALLDALIDQRTLIAFAEKFGFFPSKRLIDAEIAQIPDARGLNGQFSDEAYQGFLARRRMTDAEVRQILTGGMLQRLLLTPVAANGRMPVGMATPYASMMLEAREGLGAAVPVEAFAVGLKPSDAQLQIYYGANRNRYMIPEQRTLRIAAMGPAAVESIAASDQEITAFYNANQATYGSASSRSLAQVVVPDQRTAAAIAARARGGATLEAAAAPAGSNAAVSDLPDQNLADYGSAAGNKIAAAVFTAPAGGIVGPLQSDFGWVVVKVTKVDAKSGKTLAQARSEISARLTADKRKEALEALVTKVQDAIDEGGNFAEAAAAARLTVVTTPLVMANGASRTNASQRLPQGLEPAIKAGFEIAPNDQPEIIALPGDAGYALVAPATVVPAAPAPLAAIRDRVARDWILGQATARAKSAAQAIAAKVSKGMPLAEAVKQAGVPLPAPQPLAARRLQIANAKGDVPPPLQMLFTLAEGKSRMVADSSGRGFFVVKANKIIPGNALLQPALITQMQSELQDSLSEEYARQFVAALRKEMELERNDQAIAALQARLRQGGN
ncbi:MAG: peptidyl-prolyl cis-trans isomerase [Sphingomicrobium sp.]